MTWSVVVLMAAAALADGGVEPIELPPVDAGTPHQAEPVSSLVLRGAVEVSGALFPSGYATNGVDLLGVAHPVIAFGVGDDFLIELGPTFRLRVADFAPENRSTDLGGVLRGADWDELSDFGQIVQDLRVGQRTGPFFVRVGPSKKKTLGFGHLLWRYDNTLNPNYHPASGELAVRVGPVRGEFFASDVLGARLFGGELAWDIGGTFNPELRDRFGLAFSLIHDANLAGRPFRHEPDVEVVKPSPVTLLHLDGHALLTRTGNLKWMVLAGVGTRATVKADLGFLVGTTVDAQVADVGLSTRIELRKQAGGFRHGFFGPMYELQRFADVGYQAGAAIQDVLLPDSGSAFGEVRVGLGTHVSFDVAAEYFFWKRLDLDGGLSVALFGDWFFASLRTTMLGLLQAPRYAFTGGLRWRVLPSFYVLAEGGTVFFPQPDGSLIRGVMGSLGVGLDFEKR